MPRGPNGEWRPAGTGACAVHVMKIATGQIEETYEPPPKPKPDPDVSRKAARGGKARAEKLPAGRRRQIATRAAQARWGS